MTKKFEELNDSQWAAISEFFDINRKRKHDLRIIVNALFYIVRTGCQWRNLPPCYPPWRAVNYYFERWKRDNRLEQINEKLNQLDRQKVGKEAFPSLMCIDSQSVKLAPMIFEDRGIDANKKVNGRKRQFLVDSDGRLWRVLVHAANLHDGVASCSILDTCSGICKRLKKILGDKAYGGIFASKMLESSFEFESVSRLESSKGFVPLAKRWVVERSIAWTNFFRRVVKDYEYTTSSSESWLLLANSAIMLHRLHPNSE